LHRALLEIRMPYAFSRRADASGGYIPRPAAEA
jgi:hypothetical protein